MSVIGRLDEQVEDILIAPVKKNRPKINHEPADKPGAGESAETARPDIKKRSERDELPVWLL